jgi:histidine triad (HIT) family protein
MDNCIFCAIIEKKAPARYVFESEEFIIIKPLTALAPVHLLIIPRRHFSSLNDLTPADDALAGRLLMAARKAAELAGIPGGYRTVINTGAKGGQTVFHLHIHMLGGSPLDNSLLTKGLK